MSSFLLKHLTRRDFIRNSILTGTAAYLGYGNGFNSQVEAMAAEPPPEVTSLRLRVWRPSCWAPFHVAEPLLREEGFTDIEYIKASGPKLPQLFRDGAIDLSPEFVSQGMSQMEQENPPFKFLSGLHVGCYALVGSENIQSVRDLKGKTVWAGSLENNGPHIFFSIIVSYVGLDPRKDINYVWVKKDEAMRLFNEGKVDAFMSFPPGPQELMGKGIGRLLVDTNVDRPWSQYFCCMIVGRDDFVKNHPVATKRAMRAILRANDMVAQDPQHALQVLQQKKIWTKPETQYILQSLQEIPYAKWRDYNPEETIRFNALRLREVGMIKTPPEDFIARHTDWRTLKQLKNEMNMTW
jgi:NitT/TauT family transport system substrate-binding protein